MATDPEVQAIKALKDRIAQLLAALHTAHDHLHHDRINEAHQALHCDGVKADEVVGNIRGSDAASLHAFIAEHNRRCEAYGINAAVVVLVPSATVPGKVSVQIGGAVIACQMVERAFRAPSTYAGGPRG